jgi:hypothetical protein
MGIAVRMNLATTLKWILAIGLLLSVAGAQAQTASPMPEEQRVVQSQEPDGEVETGCHPPCGPHQQCMKCGGSRQCATRQAMCCNDGSVCGGNLICLRCSDGRITCGHRGGTC